MAKSRKKKGSEPLLPSRLLPLKAPRPLLHALAFGAAAGILFLVVQCLFLPMVTQDGKVYFLDPDSYAWCERAGQVLEGRFFIHRDGMDNYPEGYESHWTQPFHWILALFAVLLGSIETAGLWICPIFGALVAGMLGGWAFRRWPWHIALLCMATFLLNPFELWTFNLGRPDHQCILIGLLMTAVLILLDLRPDATRRRAWIAASALLIAAAVWVSVQALSLWALVLGVLTLQAGIASVRERSERLLDAVLWSATAAGAAFLFFLIERQGRLDVISDSLSLGQVILMAAPVAGLYGAVRMRRFLKEMAKPRWFVFIIFPPLFLSLAAGFWLWSYQEKALDQETLDAMGRWFSTNLEFLPALFFVNGEAAFGRLHGSLAYTLYALPFLLFGLARTRLLGSTGKWILGAGILAASLLTLWQMRWRDLHALLIAPTLAVGVYECFNAFFFASKERKRIWTVAIPFAAGLLLLYPWITDTGSQLSSRNAVRPDFVALRLISERIKEIDPYDPEEEGPSSVLAPWGHGPLVKYWSGRPVIAGPYHRNMEGILDTMRAYTARTQEAFDEIASKRKVRYVLRPPPENPLHPDPSYDLYTFEWVAGIKNPILWIRSEFIAMEGTGTGRVYDLSPGVTPQDVEEILRMRLENNKWKGWKGLKPVKLPGLERIYPDADFIPYLYRHEKAH